eukprot:5189342-Pyramimonas_sp.AAC.2
MARAAPSGAPSGGGHGGALGRDHFLVLFRYLPITLGHYCQALSCPPALRARVYKSRGAEP